MGPSEAEIEARLAALRRRREAIDREIADLLLYLELGRRLSGSGAGGVPPPDAPPPGPLDPPTPPAPGAPAGAAVGPAQGRPADDRPAQAPPAPRAPGDAEPPARPDPAAGRAETRAEEIPQEIPPAAAFAQDPVGARRYGRALVEAACAVIAEARRPLHASAILPHLIARGFTVPGADPVAALNTRLWKRAGPGGPLIRLGDAVYALAGWTEVSPTSAE